VIFFKIDSMDIVELKEITGSTLVASEKYECFLHAGLDLDDMAEFLLHGSPSTRSVQEMPSDALPSAR